MFIESTSCPYFTDGRIASFESVMVENSSRDFDRLLEEGFRRYGPLFYRAVCEDCHACIPIRIPADRFVASKSQRRTLRKNRETGVSVVFPPAVTYEKVSLFLRYGTGKHGRDKENFDDQVRNLANLHHGYPYTVEMHYYHDSLLIGVGIIDITSEALSSNYFYYDTGFPSLRPGIFSILKEIDLARSLNKQYLYLGYLIGENTKMAYKNQFLPYQILVDGAWIDVGRVPFCP